MWVTLRRDRVVQIALAATTLLALPFLLPLTTRETVKHYSLYVSNVPLILLAIGAFQYRLRRSEGPAGRRFWNMWTAGLGLWLVQDLALWATADRPGPTSSLVQDALLVGFYLFLVLAVRLRPDRGPELPPRSPLRSLEAAGTVVFTLGWFGYFSFVPFLHDRSVLATDVPSLVLYVVLDSLLVLHLAAVARAAADPRWRVLYRWLLAAAALFLLTDAIEAMMLVKILPGNDGGGPLDLLWWTPFLALVGAARLREHPFPAPASSRSELQPPRPHPLEQLWGDPLVAYAATFPLLHFLLYSFGALDPATRPAREVLALVVLVVLGGLALAYQKLLLAESQRLAEARAHAAEAEHRAYHDALTGLPNRYLLQDRLELALPRALRNGIKVALLFLDLDRFKVVNDSLGHSAGDRLLREVAVRLGPHVRKGDTLARFGGDEFALLVEGVRHAEDIVKVAHKLREALREPFPLDGRELFVTASIGISLYPDDGADSQALFKSSDIAMYRAKDQGRDGYQLFRAEMNVRAEQRLTLESDLRKALSLGQLRVQYQPIVDVRSGRFTGCEALMRWQHPQRGLLLPADFMDLAELTGVIVEAGSWILQAACRQAQSWQREAMPLSVAVNLSPRQFLQADLVHQVRGVLAETGLSPHLLELEITESLAMQNAERAGDTLKALRELGVRLSIDDFGTGYSSLGYLKNFPIDTLKIDRAFVGDLDTDLGDAAIAATVVAMARTLGLGVVAEGVEREAQLRVLRDQGCDRAQGNLFSPPLWPEEMAARAASESPVRE
jgi:diguanylate cyclase (GGDEF)-like protein